MNEPIYPLETILAAISKYKKPKVKKRLIFDQSYMGGIGSKWIIAFFLLLPIIEYAGIFNPWMFKMLGIASAIVFFIVFLSMLMIIVVALTFINNNKVIRQMTPSWKHYFPDVDLTMALSSGATPYKEFLIYYAEALNAGLHGDDLYKNLQQSFHTMQKENADLLDRMQNSRSR